MRIRALLLSFASLLLMASSAAVAADESARDRPGDFVINRPASLYTRPAADSHIIRQIRPHTVVHVVQVLNQWYKVSSTTGHEDGYVRRSYADPRGMAREEGVASRGGGGSGAGGGGRSSGERMRFRVGTFKLTDPVVVRDQPMTSARKIASLREGATVRVVDKDPSGLWYKIESETGNKPPGWIPTQAAKRVGETLVK